MSFPRCPDPAGDSATFLSFFLPDEERAREIARGLGKAGLTGCFYWYDNKWHYLRQWSHLKELNSAARLPQELLDERPDYEAVRLPRSDGIIGRLISMQIMLSWTEEEMESRLAEGAAHVDGIYICPHHPEAKEEKFRVNCDCRKPRNGLFLQAARDLQIDLSQSYMVGDRWSDLKAAAKCNSKGVLVLTGYGRGDYEFIGSSQDIQPHYVAEDLLAAVNWILHDLKISG